MPYGVGDNGNPNDQRFAYRYLNAVRALELVLHAALFCDPQAPSVVIAITANSWSKHHHYLQS